MQKAKALVFSLLAGFLLPQFVMAQAMGEYGRAVESTTDRHKGARPKGSASPSRNTKGKNDVQGIGDVGGRPLPSQLVVASNEAALYPRQDDESEKIDRLSRGDTLVPILQSNGGAEWYMVKTPAGKVGWIKSADVREEPGRKP